ncbi:DUF3429 domain-containing protein [Salicola sp. Rm-C-2C1-2]|uniref:DUF3429 domain-containing protein n=1 Tax=Salicola sp. Rm-C-2C1-2 TaxID=3141321 RepID=UPI0032E4E7CE
MLAIRPLAFIFGLAGLIPFLATLGVVVFSTHHDALGIQLFYLYSAGILAFLSGVYWPVSMQIGAHSYPLSPIHAMFLSQVFFVSAGVTLLLGWHLQALIFPVLYILLFLTDWFAMPAYWPRWYLHLRLMLTTGVVACQVAAATWLYLMH